MKNLVLMIGLIIFTSCLNQSESQENTNGPLKLLVFSQTNGYRHESIESGKEAFLALAPMQEYQIMFSEDSSIFNQPIDTIDVVVFLNTTGDLFTEEQKSNLQAFIRSGGGFVGVHSASDTEYNWSWYGELVGRYFKSHPEIQEAELTVTEKNHPATAKLPALWVKEDEWYNFNPENVPVDLRILITLDESSYEGGTMGNFHPVAWCREFEGGRSFYTALGHTAESYSDSLFLSHLAGGITWAANR